MMLPNKIDDNTYEITLYDFVNTHEDHTAGVVKRNPNVNFAGCDTYYWMYYPLTTSRQICAGDLLDALPEQFHGFTAVDKGLKALIGKVHKRRQTRQREIKKRNSARSGS